MKNKISMLLLFWSIISINSIAQKDNRFFEMRIYTAHQGKLNDLMKRFRNHTIALFEKHGMTNLVYLTPLDNPDGKLYYVLAYPSREARDQSWRNFIADTTWQRVSKESEVNGALVEKIESIFMTATDFSPNDWSNGCNRVWEWRDYTATPNNTELLLDRFRQHTVKLFEQNKIHNIAYWTPTGAEQGAGSRLCYFVTHTSQAAGLASFATFRNLPEWLRVRADSEQKAGGSLTAKITSIYMYPTDFSPIK